MANLAGTYPTDPTDALKNIENFFVGSHDLKSLMLGLYELQGFAMHLTIGDPAQITADPVIVADACNRVMQAMEGSPIKTNFQSPAIAGPPLNFVLPVWIQPILKALLTAVLAWIQGTLGIRKYATTGNLTSIPPTITP